jgi:serine/threonine protein kinase/Tol biopolymer transport system component
LSVLERLAVALSDRYRIERELGQGGMATVYLAHDLRHDRDVAIKVLHPDLGAALGPERFLSEIRTTARLQHPHILPLLDSGAADGLLYYVMPLVTGETLRTRLERERQLPIDDAVRIAREVADALGHAHGLGVIHRDIKPENILLQGGHALVADFGIALAVQTAAGQRMTQTGLSLGTPQYMSPEQAMGERAIDARSDIYALGAVTYEMLAGDPPFTGSSVQAIVAKVMTEKPSPIHTVRDTVPEHVESAVLTALAKLPADRFATAAEFAAGLSTGSGTTGRTIAPRRVTPGKASRYAWPAFACVALAVAAWGWLRPPTESSVVVPSRLEISAPNVGGVSTGLQRQIAISPDGSTLLYAASVDGQIVTMRRDLASEESVPVPGAPDLIAGFTFSPDGREFAGSVFSTRTSYRFPIEGGNGRALPREVQLTSEILWGSDGTLWIDNLSDNGNILRVTATNEITRPLGDSLPNMVPSVMLPDGRHLLALRRPFGGSAGPVVVVDLETGGTTPLLGVDVVQLRYTSGYLVYAETNGALSVVAFDPATREVSGTSLTIATGISLTGAGSAQFDVSRTGTVAYIPEAPRSLYYVERNGGARAATPDLRNFHAPQFSPDGRRISVDFTTADGRDVWLLDRTTVVLSRLTLARDGHDATWAPDGASLLYVSAPQGVLGVHRIFPGRGESAESLLTATQLGTTGKWLPTGGAIVTVGSQTSAGTGNDIVQILNGGRGPMEPVIATRFSETYPAVSPHGDLLAYVSNRSGRDEVYLRRFATGGEEVQVSTEGGTEPVWGPDGRELFYRGGTLGEPSLIQARLEPGTSPAVTSHMSLFALTGYIPATPHANYDISPDGREFVMVRQNPSAGIVVIQNLPALVAKMRGGARP